MKERLLKCKYCGEKDIKNNLQCEKKINGGKVVRKYYHASCQEQYEKNKKQEKELFEYLLRLYDLIHLPKEIIVFLRQFKTEKGIGFDIILTAYKLSENDIKYWLSHKKFENEIGQFKYTWTIVRSNLNKAYQLHKQQQEQLRKQEQMNRFIEAYEEREVVYKKKENGVDISNFL